MKKTIFAFCLAVSGLCGGASAETVLDHIGDGRSCDIGFRVLEIRSPFIAGQRLGSQPDDAWLRAGTGGDPSSALCRRIEAATSVVLSGVHMERAGLTLRAGDAFRATVLYQESTEGGLAVGRWHHIVVIGAGAGAPAMVSGLTIGQ